MRKHLPLLSVLLAGIFVHALFFGYPNQTVFDEVHFGKFVSGYFTHEYFFDIHPPLGKLLISGAGYVAGFKPGFSFASIGESFPDKTYIALRFLPMVAGSLLPVVLFLLAIELGFSRWAATSLGLLVVLENALLVQSRFMLLDAFLLLFGFLAWLLYAKFRRTGHQSYLWWAAACAGLSMSVKWTGVTFLGIMGILEFIHLFPKLSVRKFANLILLVLIPSVLYFAIFMIHLNLLYRTGPGDAFMTPQFRKTLVGSQDWNNAAIQPMGMVGKFLELNAQMYSANARLTAGHPYASKWYTWPFMRRPIYYWNNADARIYLLGNPVTWWLSTVGIFYLIITALTSLAPFPGMEKLPKNIKMFMLLLTGAYMANMLPFIGISRAMFLYHYFIGLIIAIFALIYLIDQLKYKKKIFSAVVMLALVAFVFFAPVTYGTSLSNQAFHARLWIKGWE